MISLLLILVTTAFARCPPAIIKTVARNGILSTSGDGGPASKRELGTPVASWLIASGNLYVADTPNNAVRFLTPAAGRALLSVNKTHTGNLTLGQTGASYSLSVSNSASAGATNGTVT